MGETLGLDDVRDEVPEEVGGEVRTSKSGREEMEMSLTELTEGTEGYGWIEFFRERIQSKNLGC